MSGTGGGGEGLGFVLKLPWDLGSKVGNRRKRLQGIHPLKVSTRSAFRSVKAAKVSLVTVSWVSVR